MLDHPESVATTWKLSFERVEKRNPAAADLLRLCAFLAPDAIPETIITKGESVLGDVLAPLASDPLLLGQAIEALRAYSLVQRDAQSRTLRVHRLVQVIVRGEIASDQHEEWQHRVMRAVVAAVPDVADVKQWEACERWLPHGLLCTTWIVEQGIMEEKAALLLNQEGYYLERVVAMPR